MSNPTHLHSVANSVQQRGNDIASATPQVSLPSGALGALAGGHVSNTNNVLAGVNQHGKTLGSNVGNMGGTLHSTASNIETNESDIEGSFNAIAKQPAPTTKTPTSTSSSGPTLPSSSTTTPTFQPPKRPASPSGPSGPPAKKPNTSGPNYTPPQGPASTTPSGPSTTPSSSTPTPPVAPPPKPPAPPPPVNPPAPPPPAPPVRPPNYKPTIPQSTHDHAAFGGWNNYSGKATGGHMLSSDLGGAHDPGYTSGTGGAGVVPGSGKMGTQFPNGVYVYKNPTIAYAPAYGNQTKLNTYHTMFPPGTSQADMQKMGNAAWNDPGMTFQPNPGGKPGGQWWGSTTIPGSGQKINIQGYYDGSGKVTSYYPDSSSQS